MMLAEVLESFLLPHTILDLTVLTKTQGWPESFETKNRPRHLRASTYLRVLPFHQEFVCRLCLLFTTAVFPSKSTDQICGKRFPGWICVFLDTKNETKTASKHPTSWSFTALYRTPEFLAPKFFPTLAIHSIGFIAVKIGNFTICTVSISKNTDTSWRSGRSGQLLGTQKLDSKERTLLIKK